MMMLKACTRCGGDMHSRSDMYGPYHECLQCGHLVDDAKPVIKVKQAVGTKKAAA
jgi:DNA-directed RNA polymerase subunit RPC12/RpoP